MLLAGQELSLRRIPPQDQRGSVVYATMQRLGLIPQNVVSAWVTKADALGISVRVNRQSGGDIEAFFPVRGIRWDAYFESLPTRNPSYASVAHYSRIFPAEFLRG